MLCLSVELQEILDLQYFGPWKGIGHYYSLEQEVSVSLLPAHLKAESSSHCR